MRADPNLHLSYLIKLTFEGTLLISEVTEMGSGNTFVFSIRNCLWISAFWNIFPFSHSSSFHTNPPPPPFFLCEFYTGNISYRVLFCETPGNLFSIPFTRHSVLAQVIMEAEDRKSYHRLELNLVKTTFLFPLPPRHHRRASKIWVLASVLSKRSGDTFLNIWAP